MSLADLLRRRAGDPVWASETNKVQKRALQREKFLVTRPGESLLWRPRGAAAYGPFTADDLGELRRRFERAGNAARLDA